MKTVEQQAVEAVEARRRKKKAEAGVSDKPMSPEIFTADSLMSMDIPPERWAVEGIVPEGLTVLAGKPKLGKSWLALHLALAIGAGGMALGRIGVEGGSVLYLSLEDTKRRLRKRIIRLLGPDEQPSKRVSLSHTWPRMDRGGLDEIERWIIEHPEARLVVIDTWAKFKPIRAGKTDYEIDYADGGQMKALADKFGICIVIVHHCRKLGASDALEEVSGSVGLTGACDGVLMLRRERGQHDATLLVTGRDVQESELALAFDLQHCLWQLMGDAEDYRISKERAELIEALRKAGRPLSPTEVAATLGKKREVVKNLLWKMAADGQISVMPDGKYICRDRRDRETFETAETAETGAVSDADDSRDRSRDRENHWKTPWG